MLETYRYQHRSSETGLQRDRASREKIVQALAAHRQLLSQSRARIRTLTGRRNEMVAQAIAEGVRISTVAAAIGETVPRVRSIALSFDDSMFGNTAQGSASADRHLSVLRKLALDLQSAIMARESLENQLGVLVTHAYRLGYTDETHLAGLAGISSESVHQHLRGLRRSAAR